MNEKNFDAFIEELIINQLPSGKNAFKETNNKKNRTYNRYKTFNPHDIVNVRFDDPRVSMKFKDGTTTVAEVQEGDEFNKETGMMVCIMQYIFQDKTYNNMFRKWIKRYDDKCKIAEQMKLQGEEAKKVHDRQEAKKKRRREKRKEKEREEAIEIQKEAYLRAMKEYFDQENESDDLDAEFSKKDRIPVKLKIKSKKREGSGGAG